ncbi:cupin domain-containing protein [Methanocella arvoryzae]|nr:cupin domain-containing protein [Methanocella arvoryzae]
MMETPIYKGKPPAVHNVDDYRRGLRNRPNESTIEVTAQHKVDLWTIMPGLTMPEHLHPGSECVLLVIDGRGDITIAGQTSDLKKGSLTIIPPHAHHSVRNTGPDPLVILTTQGPGPFETRVEESPGSEKIY